MSHSEKAFIRIATLTLAVLAFQACGKGFHSASHSSEKASSEQLNSFCADCGGGNTLPPVMNGIAPNYSALTLSLEQLMQVTVSNLPGISTLSSCEAKSACTGAGPSSLTISQNCSSGGTSITGSTLVTFNGAQCNPLVSSQIVVAPQINLTTPGQTIQISSTPTADYNGPIYGGGIEVGYSLLSLSGSVNNYGLHITGTGLVPIDVVTHTTSPLTASISPSTLSANITGGTIVLSDKIGGYTATLTASGLTFNTTCACPVSGSFAGNLSGPISGSISLAFGPTCGSVTTTVNGASTTSTSPGCAHQ